METKLKKLFEWFSLNSRGGRLIEAGDIPSDFDLDSIDWDGSEDELERLLRKIRMPKEQSYWLGSVTTGPIGMEGSASHTVERGKGGRTWTLYASGADFHDETVDFGTFSSKQILSEVESLGYRITLREWISMGWRP